MIPKDTTLKKYCKNYNKIENYYDALTSSDKWVCHHKKGLYLDRTSLLYNKEYYDLPYEDLVFLPLHIHTQIHTIFKQYSEFPGVIDTCKRYEKRFKDYTSFVEFLIGWQDTLKILYKRE